MSEFVEVIEFFDETGQEMAHRFPEKGSAEIKLGAQLVVRESQEAIFFRDGKALDTFGPGSFMLSTENIPIITKVLSLPYGFKSPFRAEVYFINRKTFLNLKWGTKEPILFRDTELKMVRLRAFGMFSLRVKESQLFVNKVVGTRGVYATSELGDFYREIIVGRFNDLLGENLKTIFDLPKYYDELATALKSRLVEDFGQYGIELIDLIINSVSIPEDVQKIVDERSGLEAVGGLQRYMQFKAAKALEEAAKNPSGGSAGAGVGIGAGLGMGVTLAQMLQQSMKPDNDVKPVLCAKCNSVITILAKFCPECGEKLTTEIKKCQKCNAEIPVSSKFCPFCGVKI